MKILGAYDMGADGVELLVHLDETRVVPGPDGDEDFRPDPKWLWRACVPAATWATDQSAALSRVAELAQRQVAQRTRALMPELAGLELPTTVVSRAKSITIPDLPDAE